VPVRVIFVPIRPWNPVLMVSVMARRGNWGRIGASYFLILPWCFSAIIPTHRFIYTVYMDTVCISSLPRDASHMTICGHGIFIYFCTIASFATGYANRVGNTSTMT
jgi:hypothetical protein